ncbi:MAG: hypothetical protein M1820_008751 [Bogoriella megaspora]|nr:MAG: hypothetical protein M1820_008751 [Bogoriella megaspora]
MPHVVHSIAGKKRKLPQSGAPESSKRKTGPGNLNEPAGDEISKEEILLLESQIVESRRNYNNIAILLSHCKNPSHGDESIAAAVALCRVFCRLIASGEMMRRKDMRDNEVTIIQWLKARCMEYTEHLYEMMKGDDQGTAIVLAMRLVKESGAQDENVWRTGSFYALLRTLVFNHETSIARDEFFDKYVKEYDDIRYYTLRGVEQLMRELGDETNSEVILDAVLNMLSVTENLPSSSEEIKDFFTEAPPPKHPLRSVTAHQKAAQNAWVTLMAQSLTMSQRKRILNQITSHVAPSLKQPELLMDFLTESFNSGGSSSLLALSGLYHLITVCNLDYPNFYSRLYSLLDGEMLHSKHRSRFFRLLNTFLSSTHLPAILVASFIKRLARLALTAPPSAIVAVIPFVYNMLQGHRQCTFMVHRERHPNFLVWQKLAANDRHPDQSAGLEDPFDMNEVDPTKTNALESSLWELDTLRSHYHPNVATLSGILAQQFTKKEYQLEDFLDHSYKTLIESELGKEVKKAPVVEWEIPKRIFTSDDGGMGQFGKLMKRVREDRS